MTDTNKSALLAAIDSLVESKTFNLDALNAITALRDKAAALERQAETATLRATSAEKEVLRLNGELTAAKAEIDQYRARDAALVAREKSVFEQDALRRIAEARADTYRNAMEIVFKPNTVRESIHRSGTVPVPTGNGGSFIGSSHDTTTTERNDG